MAEAMGAYAYRRSEEAAVGLHPNRPVNPDARDVPALAGGSAARAGYRER
jgi:hypothetical protein